MLWDRLFIPGKNCFRASPALSGVGVFALYGFFGDIPGAVSFILIISCILFVAEFLFLWAAFLNKCLGRGYGRTALSVIVVPLLIVGLRDPIHYVNDCLHLLLEQKRYEREIAALPNSVKGKFTTFDWSTGFAGGPATFLIYDESDEIALPMDKHTSRAGYEAGFGPDCAGKVTRLFSHYYVCTF